MSDVTLSLTEAQASDLQDAVRWSRENAEEKNLRRVANRMMRVEELLEEQIGD